MYENLTGRISENTLSGRKNKIMNKVEKNKKKGIFTDPFFLQG